MKEHTDHSSLGQPPRTLLACALLLACVFRLIWPLDMEFKEDEIRMFLWSTPDGGPEWRWLGMTSGVYLRNPGMSVWIFQAWAWLTRARTPEDVLLLVTLSNLLALGFLVLWSLLPRSSLKPSTRALVQWVVILACVNPIWIAWERKIWAQSVLPLFSVLFFWAWTQKSRPWGAFFWGAAGALLGQIHMSGFFFAGAFFLGTLASSHLRRLVRWKHWILGSILLAIPLIPWVVHVGESFLLQAQPAISRGWAERVQLKFWVFALTDPLGLHLGKILGVKLGNGLLDQLGPFFQEPRIPLREQPTYLVGALHLFLALLGLITWVRFLLSGFWKSKRGDLTPLEPDFKYGLLFSLGLYGVLLTVPAMNLYRFYLLIAFFWEAVFWVVVLARSYRPEVARRLLVAQFVALSLIAAQFLWVIHRDGGAPSGDYGPSLHMRPNWRQIPVEN